MAYGVKYYRGTLPASILSEVFEKIAREMEHSSTLPELVNEHPHAMFDLLLSIWQPDGRNGESITQTQIANEISEKIGREFNKNAYILKFIGKVIARKFYRQLIKPDEARAFLEIVFREWTGALNRTVHQSISKC